MIGNRSVASGEGALYNEHDLHDPVSLCLTLHALFITINMIKVYGMSHLYLHV